MDEIVPTAYATIELRSERLGELQQCLMAHGFALKYVQSPKREFWAIEDEIQEMTAPMPVVEPG